MEHNNDLLIYQTEDGKTKIDVRLENETVWMTQKKIAERHQKGVNIINEHIRNIYEKVNLKKTELFKLREIERLKEQCVFITWK